MDHFLTMGRPEDDGARLGALCHSISPPLSCLWFFSFTLVQEVYLFYLGTPRLFTTDAPSSMSPVDGGPITPLYSSTVAHTHALLAARLFSSTVQVL